MKTTHPPRKSLFARHPGTLFSLAFAGAMLLAPVAAHAVTYTVTNTNDDGDGSLRFGIAYTNARPGLDTIQFNIGSGAQTIRPASPLPAVSDAVVIDGTTQPGYAGKPLIELSGAGVPNVSGTTGLTIAGGGSYVKSLSFTGWSTFNGCALRIDGGDPFATTPYGTGLKNASTISNCYFGLRPDGVSMSSNVEGVEIMNSSNNTIGGLGQNTRNYFGGGQSTAIRIAGAWSNNNQILGNYVGLRPDGQTAGYTFENRWIPANTYGIQVNGGSGNIVGGSSQEARNVICDTGQVAIQVLFCSNVRVTGNFIGLDPSGTARLGGQTVGIDVWQAPGTVIGGTGIDERNTVSGSSDDAIRLRGDKTTNCTLLNNHIGTNWGGTGAIGNGANGIHVYDSASNITIGGQYAGTRNLISGNTGAGVLIEGGAKTVRVQGNFIGINFFGETAVPNGNGVVLQGTTTDNVIGGDSSLARNLISGNTGNGVVLNGGEVKNNKVQANWIGLQVDGQKVLPNGGSGLVCDAVSNQIGGLTDAPGTGQGNVISGNGAWGIDLPGAAAQCDVQGNLIGTNAYGYSALGNGKDGVRVSSTSRHDGNRIGGTDVKARNVISGNKAFGIQITGYFTGVTMVLNNYIGTNNTGTSALGNASGGVLTADYGSGNRIGLPDAGNLISGNNGPGVVLSDNSQLNYVAANRIGTNAAGTAALPNNGHGIFIKTQSGSNIIGMSVAGGGNLISGNIGDGVRVEGEKPLDLNNPLIYISNSVVNNFIGTDVTGTKALGNSGAGVGILDAHYNVVGGLGGTNNYDPLRVNRIAFNGGAGVVIGGENSYGHEISANVIFGNGNIGINLAKNDGSPYSNTPNDDGDADEGPNHLQNTPVITRAALHTSEVVLIGTLDAKPNATYCLDFYRAAQRIAANAANAETYLGRLTLKTDAAGHATFEYHAPMTTAGGYYTATATDDKRSTSELAAPVAAAAADTTAPTVTIEQPVTGQAYRGLTAATGTAADNPGGSGLASTTLLLYRAAANGIVAGYWNGQTWQAGAYSLPLQVNNNRWSFTFPTAAQGMVPDRYALSVIARDLDGNTAQTPGLYFILKGPDTVTPSVRITTPTDGATTWVPQALGTASDDPDGDGLQSVTLLIRREATTGVTAGFWNGTTRIWSTTEVENPVTLGTGTAQGTWSYLLPTYAQGFVGTRYQLRATALDRNHNPASHLITFTVPVDRTPPTVSLTTPADNGAYTTLATAAGTAADNTGGTGLARVEVQLFRYGFGSTSAGYWNAATKTWGNGYYNTAQINGNNWSFTLPTRTEGFVDARYSLVVRSVDGADNTSTSAQATFILGNPDLNAPRVSITVPYNGGVYPDLRAFRGLMSDDKGVTSVEVLLRRDFKAGFPTGYWNGTDWTTTATPANYRPARLSTGTWTFDTPTAQQGFGPNTYTLYVQARDAAGNIGIASSVSFTIDPAATTDTMAPALDVTDPAPNAFIRNPNIVMHGTATDNTGGSGLATVTALIMRPGGNGVSAGYWNGSAWVPQVNLDCYLPASLSGNNWSMAFPAYYAAIGPGLYAFQMTARDKAGNQTILPFSNFMVDTAAPVVNVTAPVAGDNAGVPAITGTVTDPIAPDGRASGIARMTVRFFRVARTGVTSGYWQGGSLWTSDATTTNDLPATVQGTGWRLTMPTAAQGGGPGSYVFYVTATDRAGNVTALSAFSFRVTGATGATLRTVDAESPAPAEVRYPCALSTAGATSDGVRLVFIGALDASTATDTVHYAVEVNGNPVLAEAADLYDGDREVRLSLPEDALAPGDKVNVSYEVRDARGRLVRGETGLLVVTR